MKTISLRTLVREPLKVKRLTRAGKSVRVTDGGAPLWIVSSDVGENSDESERRRAIERIFEEVLHERPSKISAARILEDSRR